MAAGDVDALVPQWPAPPGVQAVCSTRAGGVSAAPYDSLNLGDHVSDNAAAVATNRVRWRQRLGARPVFLQQVHGRGVLALSADTPDGAQADACLTTEPALACTVMVADCLPVLLCDRAGRVVAAAHAGWRGLAGERGEGVLEAVYKQIRAVASADTAPAAIEIIAWLGPCIGPQAFEVGPEVRQAFVASDPGASALFGPYRGGKYLADLPGLARRRLAALGVRGIYGNDGSTPWCTVANASRFFSHRRDGTSGRFAASIWRA